MNKKDAAKLRSGVIIKHKKNNDWVYLVSANFGSRITAVRTVEIRENDLINWEIVDFSKENED